MALSSCILFGGSDCELQDVIFEDTVKCILKRKIEIAAGMRKKRVVMFNEMLREKKGVKIIEGRIGNKDRSKERKSTVDRIMDLSDNDPKLFHACTKDNT